MEENPYKAPAQAGVKSTQRPTMRLWILAALVAYNAICAAPMFLVAYAEWLIRAPVGGALFEVLFYGAHLTAMVAGSAALIWLLKKLERFIARRRTA